VYYAWALLSGLVGTGYSFYKQLSTPAIQGQSEWFFWVFVVGVVGVLLVAPILIAAIIRTSNPSIEQVANPTLAINSRHVVYEIKPTGLVKKQTLTLEALEITEVFRFVVSVTGDGKTTVALTSPGVSLLGPTQRGSGDSYEIKFANPLEKGQLTTISFDIVVDDPNRTMRCFLADRFHNAARYGAFRATYVFQAKPSAITRERQSVAGETLESNNQLHCRQTASGFEYDIKVAKVDAHCVYSVAWVW
jgi:hypothetical protein